MYVQVPIQKVWLVQRHEVAAQVLHVVPAAVVVAAAVELPILIACSADPIQFELA